MDAVIKIALLIALIAFIYLIYAIVNLVNDIRKTLYKANNTIDIINKEFSILSPKISLMADDMRELKTKVNDTLKQFDQLQITAIQSLENVGNLSSKVNDSITVFEEKSKTFFSTFEPVEKLLINFNRNVAPTLNHSVSYLSAIIKGYKAFNNKLSK